MNRIIPFFALLWLWASSLVVVFAYPLGDSSIPRPQSDLRRPVLFHQSFSCCQLLIGDTLSDRRDNKTIQPLKGMDFHVAEIQTESKLIDVSAKMLFTRVMIDAAKPALQNRPNAFYRVRMSYSTAIFALSSGAAFRRLNGLS